MKKPLLILVPAFLLMLASCRKDRVCTCTENGTEVYTGTIPNSKRSEAKNTCSAFQSTAYGNNPNVSCTVR